MTNSQLCQYVLDELSFDPSVDSSYIGVIADDGVVTLSGHVGSYAEKVQAVKAARRVKGVRGIADEIEVRFPADKKTADDEIAQRAVAIIKWDVMIPANAVTPTVRDGWVTLTGVVDWHYQRRAAEQDVRKLSGIRGVTNLITLIKRVHNADIRQNIERALKRHAEAEARDIRIQIDGGHRVVLNGNVGSWDERAAVESAAWSAPGVTDVETHLTVAAG